MIFKCISRSRANRASSTLLLFLFLAVDISAQGKLEFILGGFDKRIEPTFVKYKGDMVNGQPEGNGVAYDAKEQKTKIYQGSWKNGKPDGFGKWTPLFNRIIRSYEGNFKDGLFDGKGKLIYWDEYGNNIGYDGDWVKGKKNGKGTEGSYTGDWVDDMKQGKGTELRNAKTGSFSERYVGDFAGNKLNGKGNIVYNNGDK
ncbi:MAG: hypothetical protein E6Q24_11340 [Chitinophagaceae bacterium]|nr:MAG: hypothetical protein E6Q24_11340 [Chitinophagaceae bacterium]